MNTARSTKQLQAVPRLRPGSSPSDESRTWAASWRDQRLIGRPFTATRRVRTGLSLVSSLAVHAVVIGWLGLLASTPALPRIVVESGRASVALQATLLAARPQAAPSVPLEVPVSTPESPEVFGVVPLDAVVVHVERSSSRPQPREPVVAIRPPERVNVAAIPPSVARLRPERAERWPLGPSPGPSPAPRQIPTLPKAGDGTLHLAELPPGARAPDSPGSVDSRGARADTLRLVHNPAPEYPPDALAARHTGRTLLRVAVAVDGSVVRVSVQRSSGSASLDEAALAAVRQWRFEPVAAADRTRELLVPVRFVIVDS